ncbi:MAG: substrate-binding domain-containing protein [Oscillospiraceae bacterium]|nr:substrate-binding domain-containing protein [Oscillospiraceae bacterium]
MKKFICILLVVLLLLVPLAACQNTPPETTPTPTPAQTTPTETPEPVEEDENHLIGIIVPAATHGWTAAIAYHAEQMAIELGWQVGTDYLIWTSTSVSEMANQIDDMIALNPAAIVLMPHNDELSVTAQQITDAGIPWVLFNRRVTAEYTAYMAGDNFSMGRESARHIGNWLGGEGTVAVMHVPTAGSTSVERVSGFVEVMEAEFPDIVLIDVTSEAFTQEAGLAMATDMLTANPHLDAIYSINDIPSLGVLQAVREAGRTDIQLISGGGGAQVWYNQIVANEDMELFTATYSPAMIRDAIQKAIDILAGRDVPHTTRRPTTIINRDNVEQFLDPSLPY